MAARIEGALAAQMRATASAYPGAPAALAVGGGWAVCYASTSPFSAAVGMGLGGSVEAEEVDAMERHLGRGGAPIRVEVGPFTDPSLRAHLAERGYAVHAFQQVWWRAVLPEPVGLAPAADLGPPGAEVRRVRPGDEETWLELAARSFVGRSAEGALRDMLGSMLHAAGNACFLGTVAGEPAAVAIAAAHGDVAWLSTAGVIPRLRGRRLQSSLLAARLRWARQQGCDLAASATHAATASQRSLERAGFRCAYPKIVLVRAAVG